MYDKLLGTYWCSVLWNNVLQFQNSKVLIYLKRFVLIRLTVVKDIKNGFLNLVTFDDTLVFGAIVLYGQMFYRELLHCTCLEKSKCPGKLVWKSVGTSKSKDLPFRSFNWWSVPDLLQHSVIQHKLWIVVKKTLYNSLAVRFKDSILLCLKSDQ